MNYTQPDKPEHEDTPDDWLQSALAFAAALGHLLHENEGVVIDVKGDMKSPTPKLLVACYDNMVHILEYDQDAPAGTMVSMVDSPEEL